ncbi:carboxymuconolactone decarboxylase family protein [Nocardia sp. BMG51109]|uniref:carboxymuconolactone decarboxylase family protein n=1 Tax=Nocardia sp. BMG51109 TaxID=1056816 RepID=UPI000463F08D|nr:carboxymuconolactone decarboxylase family protein [Nocardia sp. BMG51109]
MARIPYPSAATLDAESAAAVERFPVTINIVRMIPHATSLAGPLLELAERVMSTLELSPRHREMLVLVAAHELDCEYEWVQHVPQARSAGLDDTDLERLSATNPSAWPDPVDETVFRAGRACVRGNGCDAETMADLTDKLGVRRALEALYVAGFIRMFAAVINSIDLEIDPSGDVLATAWRTRAEAR